MNGVIKCIILCMLVWITSCGVDVSSPPDIPKDSHQGDSPPNPDPGQDPGPVPDPFPLEYRIGLFQDQDFDPQKVTHIILVGSAMHEDSDQFFQSGVSRAYRYKETWPDRQVVIMSTPDVINRTDEQVFLKYNIKVIKQVNERFTASRMIAELGEFPYIASFDFFGHSSPWALKIDDLQAPFDPESHMAALARIRKNFIPNAFVTLNGCNTGFTIAPNLSRALELPVSGSLTSSVFERVESDGFWYKQDDQNSSRYVYTNKTSFNKKLYCSTGACTRMKSSRHNYDSYWGIFKGGGLSFDKFFCDFQDSDGRCERGMALSLMGFPSLRAVNLKSSTDEFKNVIFDWLCSTGKDSSYFNKCVAGIEDAVIRQDLIYRSHPTNELNCNFKSCNVEVKCNFTPEVVTPIPGSCDVLSITNLYPTNVVREYLSLINGFNQIREQ